jgi:tetratricopeptide (TPR) repeat protein
MAIPEEQSMHSYTPSAALPRAFIDRRDVREALSQHDFGQLFFLARKWAGISYSKISESTGIKPERVSTLARGEGSITSFSKIGEIADGLRIPGYLLGLTPRPWENPLAPTIAPTSTQAMKTGDENGEVRRLLAHAAEVTMGVSDGDADTRWPLTADEATPTPTRISTADVDQIEKVTAGLRALDYQYGGGTCRDAVLAQTRWVAKLLHANADDANRRRLFLTLADLHNLAGWTSLDIGLYSVARRHFAHAITQSQHAQEPSLLANALYRTGRLHLHRGMTQQALRFFQLGQIAAQDCGDAATVAVLCANEAWAYGILGDSTQAIRSLNRASDELARAHPNATTPWVLFFGEVDLQALTGMTHLELSRLNHTHLAPAREALTGVIQAREEGMARSLAFETTALAVICLRDGDQREGLDHGWAALSMAEQLRSARVVDRLSPLADQATSTASAEAIDLAHRITTVQTA